MTFGVDTTAKTHLPDNSALEHNQHEERKQAVIPILIQTPKADAEDLEDEEWGGCLFREQFRKSRNWDVECIVAIKPRKCFEATCLQRTGFEKCLQGRFVGRGIRKGSKGQGIGGDNDISIALIAKSIRVRIAGIPAL